MLSSPPSRLKVASIVKMSCGIENTSRVARNQIITPCCSSGQNMPGQGNTTGGYTRKLVAKRVGQSFRDVAKIEYGPSVDELVSGMEDDAVVVRVRFAGVNGGCETFRCRGEYAFSRNVKEQEFSLGAEGVGEIVACGSSSGQGIAVGSPVMFVGGAFSEYVKIKAAMCTPIETLHRDYVSIRISGNVAHAALQYVAKIQQDDVVFVSAAAGATGSFAVQYAKHMGCHVVATCRNDEKAEVLKGYGVDCIIQYTKENVDHVLRREGYANAIDVAYEGVGGTMQAIAWEHLRPSGGRLLSVGYISEYPHTQGYSSTTSTRATSGSLPPSDELFWGGKTVRDPQGKTAYGNVWPTDVSLRQASLYEVCELYKKGIITPLIDPTEFHGLESIPDSIEYMLSGMALGKVIVSI
jgi:NADPH-dependent curcumin reductase CurA